VQRFGEAHGHYAAMEHSAEFGRLLRTFFDTRV